MTEEINQIKTTLRNYRKNPNRFFINILGVEPWEKQQEINNLIARYKRITVRSCHASGKTWDISRIVAWWLTCFSNSICITTAPTFRQVEQIIWRNIRTAHTNSKIPLGGELLKTRWDFAEDWFAVGLSTDEPEAFQGFHGKYIMIIVDEASGVDEKTYEAIEGILAGGKAKLVLIGNPTRLVGSFAQAFKSKSYKKIHISGFDTPNVKENKIVIPGLMNPEYPKEMEEKYGKDSDIYRVKVLGEFPKEESDTVISLEDVEGAMKREAKPEGTKIGACDVARFGDDLTVLGVRQGNKVYNIKKLSKRTTMAVSGEIIAFLKDNDIKPENFRVDVIGIGAGVVDRLHEQGYDVIGVNVGLPPTDPETYANLRAEGYYDIIRKEIKNLDLPDDDDWLQLANIKYLYNSKGQLKIESKEDMKKRGLKSPDLADMLLLTYVTGKVRPGIFV